MKAFYDVSIKLKTGEQINGLWCSELGFLDIDGNDISADQIIGWTFDWNADFNTRLPSWASLNK